MESMIRKNISESQITFAKITYKLQEEKNNFTVEKPSGHHLNKQSK